MSEHPCHEGTFQWVRHGWAARARRAICPGEQVTVRDEFGGAESGELLPFTGDSYRVRRDDGSEVRIDWHIYRGMEPRDA